MLRNLGKAVMRKVGLPNYWLHQTYWELQMARLRLANSSPFFRRRVARLEKQSPVNLLFGCGETEYDGWIGVDGIAVPQVQLRLDLRRKLPFSCEIAAFCYSEHFLEHLAPDEGQNHLEEVFRVLQEGGRYRVAVPAAGRFMERFVQADDAFFKLAFPWAESPIDAVYHIVNWNGIHRNIFTFERLHDMGMKAGFAQVIESQANQSEVEALRIDRDQPQRVAETLYVEMIKN